ncbi:MAG: ferredoxin reductase family protein [Acidimicrobiales bacterium]
MTSTIFDPSSGRIKGRDRAQSQSRPGRPPHPWIGKVCLALAGAGLAISVGLALTSETRSELLAPGGVASFIGSVTGLVGTYLALLMVLLVSRIPAVERILGQDGLLRWHRRLGPWPIGMLVAHAVFITYGYAQAAKSGIWHEIGTLLTAYPDMLAATVGLGLMVMAGVASIYAIRRRLRRETWWVVHLYLYLALSLSFAHVIVLGPSFVRHPLTQAVWSLVWVATAGAVLVFRFVMPVLRSVRHRLRVVEIRQEAPGITSVICAGRNLDRLAVSGGQFFAWRFLTRGLWWQAHPYSLSAMPRPPYLRLTVKSIGDHSGAVARLQPGTWVAIEGPYGAFTRHAQQRGKAVLIGGGIGITALRALLEDFPAKSQPVVIVRTSREESVVFRTEIAELVRHRKGSLHELIGPRHQHLLDERALRSLVPDVQERDVYICGPEGFVADLVATASRLGVPKDAVHHEAFAW